NNEKVLKRDETSAGNAEHYDEVIETGEDEQCGDEHDNGLREVGSPFEIFFECVPDFMGYRDSTGSNRKQPERGDKPSLPRRPIDDARDGVRRNTTRTAPNARDEQDIKYDDKGRPENDRLDAMLFYRFIQRLNAGPSGECEKDDAERQKNI